MSQSTSLSTMRLIWSQMLFTPILLAGVGFVLHGTDAPMEQGFPGAGDGEINSQELVMTAAAVMSLTVAALAGALVLRARRGQTIGYSEALTALLVQWAMIEACGLMGFVITMLSENPYKMLVFVVATWSGFASSFPTEERLRSAAEEAGATWNPGSAGRAS
jgi:hypothetical protein